MSQADRDMPGRSFGQQPRSAEDVARPAEEHDMPSDEDVRFAAAGHVEHGDDTPAVTGTEAATSSDELAAAADVEPMTKAELLAALVEAERERDEFLDDLRRSHADFENYRKRVIRESASQREAGKAAIATSLLEVLDDLDRTLDAAETSSDAGLGKGIELVASKLVSALRDDGLQRIDGVGIPFDPSEHEAVQQVPASEPRETPIIAEVLRPGYRLGGKVLRAAMVVVEQ